MKMAERVSQEVLDLYDNIDALKSELARKNAVINQLASAILNEGPEPAYHRQVINLQRRQWPVLWQAIDQVIAEHQLKTKDAR